MADASEALQNIAYEWQRSGNIDQVPSYAVNTPNTGTPQAPWNPWQKILDTALNIGAGYATVDLMQRQGVNYSGQVPQYIDANGNLIPQAGVQPGAVLQQYMPIMFIGLVLIVGGAILFKKG